MDVFLRGQIERITYTNDENGFTVAKVKVSGRKDLVTIVGTLLVPIPGEVIEMKGNWTNHPRYGEQFKVEQYKSLVPASVYGIEKYLGSGLIKDVMIFLQTHGVGSGYATKIFKQYGNRSIRVVGENPYRLATDIFGIGFLSADRIAERLGFARDPELRAEAGILYVLHQLGDEGHVYYPSELLVKGCQEFLGWIERSFSRHLVPWQRTEWLSSKT